MKFITLLLALTIASATLAQSSDVAACVAFEEQGIEEPILAIYRKYNGSIANSQALADLEDLYDTLSNPANNVCHSVNEAAYVVAVEQKVLASGAPKKCAIALLAMTVSLFGFFEAESFNPALAEAVTLEEAEFHPYWKETCVSSSEQE